VKVGDLVKHIEDEVIGLVVDGPVVYDTSRHGKPDVYAPRFVVHWFDCKSPNEESHMNITVVSSAYKKNENNLNTNE
jgi:hypothetical protein